MEIIKDILSAIEIGDTAKALSLLEEESLWKEFEAYDFSRVDYIYNSQPDIFLTTEIDQNYKTIISKACSVGNVEFLEQLAKSEKFATRISKNPAYFFTNNEIYDLAAKDDLSVLKALVSNGYCKRIFYGAASLAIKNPDKLQALLELDPLIKSEWDDVQNGTGFYKQQSSFPSTYKAVTYTAKTCLSQFKSKTWQYNDEILDKLAAIEQEYKDGKITGFPQKWGFSAELEIQFGRSEFLDEYHNYPRDSSKLLKLIFDRADLMRELQLRYENTTDPAELDKIRLQMEKVPHFKMTDFIMWRVYDRLGDMVEFRCGHESGQTEGYYDNPGIGEVRIHPFDKDGNLLSASEFLGRYHTAIGIIKDTAEEFDKPVAIFSPHIGFSENRIHDDGTIENLTDTSVNTEERLSHSIKTSEGVLKVFNELEIINRRHPYKWGQARTDSFRTRKHSHECRDCNANGMANGAESFHTADMLLKLLKGAALGHNLSGEEKEKMQMHPSVVASYVDITHDGNSFYTARTLESAIMDEQGRFEISDSYISGTGRGVQLAKELLELDYQSHYGDLVGSAEIPEFVTQGIKNIYRMVRLDENKKLDLSELENLQKLPYAIQGETKDGKQTIHSLVIDRFKGISVNGVIQAAANYSYQSYSKFTETTYQVAELVYGKELAVKLGFRQKPSTEIDSANAGQHKVAGLSATR